jgi:GntR family transcriptional regulator
LVSLAEPMHRQVRRSLERRIESGELQVDDRLPSETELERLYGVSRTPIRRALQDLEAAGLIYRMQGRGSFVRERKIGAALRDLISFGQELRQAGHDLETSTLEVQMLPSDGVVARALGLELGDSVHHLRRLYIVDREPLALFDHYLRPVIPFDTLREAGDFPSLYELLARHGIELLEASETISAAVLEGEEASLLNVLPPMPALHMSRVTRSTAGVPVEFVSYRVRADRYEYTIDLRKTR